MGVQTCIAIAVASSAFFIGVSLFAVGVIFSDINDLYADVMGEMNGFKVSVSYRFIHFIC